MTICFYTTICAPLVSIGDFVADDMTGNDIRKILRNHIDNHLCLPVSFFPQYTHAEAFRREFIEPCLKDGYPQPGLYHTTSKLLYGESVDYLVNVIPYSDKLRDEQISPDYHDGNTPSMYRKLIIDKLKSTETMSNEENRILMSQYGEILCCIKSHSL